MFNKEGTCSGTICPDFQYDNKTRMCSSVDNRKSQLTAFLLSLFLSYVGAANFYIGQNGLGEIPVIFTNTIHVAVVAETDLYR